jgi:hypothetical protein
VDSGPSYQRAVAHFQRAMMMDVQPGGQGHAG